jgi:hypothetical protein
MNSGLKGLCLRLGSTAGLTFISASAYCYRIKPECTLNCISCISYIAGVSDFFVPLYWLIDYSEVESSLIRIADDLQACIDGSNGLHFDNINLDQRMT